MSHSCRYSSSSTAGPDSTSPSWENRDPWQGRSQVREDRSPLDYKGHRVERHRVKLECVFFGPFRDAVGEKTVRYETDTDTVGDLVAELEAAYPGLEGELAAEDGNGLAGDTVVTKDTKHVVHIDGLETPLEEGAVIRLVPSVYGG